MSKAAVEQIPNSINASVSYLAALQLAARFEDLLPYVLWVLSADAQDPQLLRFCIQTGIWGGEASAEEACAKLQKAGPRQAQVVRRFDRSHHRSRVRYEHPRCFSNL